MDDATTQPRPPGFVRAACEAAAVCLVAAVVGLAANGTRQRPLTVGGPVPTTPESCQAPPVEDARPVPFIEPTLASKRHGQAGVLFVDARPRPDFTVAHVAGAISISADDPLTDPAHLQALRQAQLVVVYCDRPQCGLSTRLGQRLRALGLLDVRVLAEGWHAWYVAGFPAQSGGEL
ncbi:MAG: rhodanese-like domain-containing protein [Deltaproteobacteria bacterium]|nr:rhodanese-like domain-containing protein [Deltaproteobacteria bacterium]